MRNSRSQAASKSLCPWYLKQSTSHLSDPVHKHMPAHLEVVLHRGNRQTTPSKTARMSRLH